MRVVIDLDEALERFHLCGHEYGVGFANHGPMVAEALVTLGHAALVTGWLDLYAPRLPVLVLGERLEAAERAAALGDYQRIGDWTATFEAEIDARSWREVLHDALCWLAPGLFAGAAHGLLRVAHAVRSLERAETSVRRRELAHGLAYWAARHQRLPGEPARGGGASPADALARVPIIPLELRPQGLFFESVRVLDGNADFISAIECFDPDALAPEDTISALCAAGARSYVDNPGSRIAYVHAVTAPSALRLLLPHMDSQTTRVALGAAFQTAAALHAISAGAPEVAAEAGWSGDAPTPDAIALIAESTPELRYRAACSLEEHAIKFTCACLIEHELAPDPVFTRAAADAALSLEGNSRRAKC